MPVGPIGQAVLYVVTAPDCRLYSSAGGPGPWLAVASQWPHIGLGSQCLATQTHLILVCLFKSVSGV